VSQAAFSCRTTVGTVELHIQPTPATITERVDYFGNILYFLHCSGTAYRIGGGSAKRSDHGDMRPRRRTRRFRGKKQFDCCPRIAARRDLKPTNSDLSRLAFRCDRSLRHMRSSRLRAGGRCERPSGPDGADPQDFRFDSGVTTVRTPTEEVFRKRKGVCQDFAHFQVACLRSLNLAARYVSGYLRTYPPPGNRGSWARMHPMRGCPLIVRDRLA
jgi:transglutaminase-like putative cysteine protease